MVTQGKRYFWRDGDPFWYKDEVIYELHVRAFCDSDGDGIGDFSGLTEKLDYLQDLGVTAIWLLPFYPSPFKDDWYDISDYTSVYPAYETMSDFKDFLREANYRGLRVITELVLNHTSGQHPWFQRARRAVPGSQGVISMSGVIPGANIKKPALSLRILRLLTGPGTRWPRLITGTRGRRWKQSAKK